MAGDNSEAFDRHFRRSWVDAPCAEWERVRALKGQVSPAESQLINDE